LTTIFPDHFLSYCACIKRRNICPLLSTSVDSWSKLLAEAETHGLGPLLYTHLKAADVSLPTPTKRDLQALYLRHRHANQVRTRVLTEILAACKVENIQVLVLKGAALAHLIYPEPGLRPMRDIDLLVDPAEAIRAQRVLAELGFDAPLPSGYLPGKHLAAATLKREGLSVSVEIHHNLFNDDFPDSMEIKDLTGEPLPFALGQLTAYTLGYEDMLWHLCRHALPIHQPLRLIWVADIVGFAETFASQIRWGRVKQQYPLVLSVLTQFHHLTPLSETLQGQANLQLKRPPEGVGQDFQGWPRYAIAQQYPKSRRQILRDTFWPSAWWLCLHYGLQPSPGLWWYRWIGHPLHILGWAGRHLWKQATLSQKIRR